MRNDLTIIYYTSNRENEEFEAKIRQKIIDNSGGLPIISVSHKPIDFGKNICIGEHTPNDNNLYRQIQLACKMAKTPYVISTEADCVYPPEYFQFVPKDTEKFYRYNNIWICYKRFNYFFKKTSSECGMMAGREFFIKQIDKMLGEPEPFNFKQWDETPKFKIKDMSPLHNWETFGQDGNPIISFKTDKGLRQFTRTISNTSDIQNLPYWGNINDLKKELSL